MDVARRRVIKSLGLGGAWQAAGAQESAPCPPGLEASALPADRVRELQPVMERRRAQLKALREFEVDDSVAP